MKRMTSCIFCLFVSVMTLLGGGLNQFVINFNPSDGLPDINISGICQDSFNRMWVGTKRGVYYYTGLGFVAFQNKDYLSFCSPNTSSIAIDNANHLWIFTEEGSGYFDILSGAFTLIPQLSGVTATDVDFDTSGNAWITTSLGIFKYSIPDSSISLVIEQAYLNPYKTCLTNENELVFTALDDNLYFYNCEKKTLKSVKIDGVTSLGLIETSGETDFIVLDGDTKVCLLHPWQSEEEGKMFFTTYKILESLATTSCLLSTGKTIWVGTSYGLEILDSVSGEYERRSGDSNGSTTLGGENIKCLYQDIEGNIWVGTYNSGLRCCIYEEGFSRYVSDGQPNSLRGSSIRAICNGIGNEIWTGSQEGYLCRFNPEERTFTDFTINSGIPYGSAITDIDFFDELLWISTFGSGVFVFDPKKQESVKHYEIPAQKCMSINETSTGAIYVGTYNGLYILDKENDEFKIIDILGDVFVHDVYEDSKGRCWISSYGKGLSFIDLSTSEIHSITKDINGNELDAKNIINLSEDSSGAIWIGTDTGILSRIVLESSNTSYEITNFDLNSDMVPVCISGIVDGGDGRLWVATTHGLVDYDSNRGKVVMVYLQNDNIVGSHLCYGGEYIDKDGTVYFGTSKGMVVFDPEFVRSKYARTKLYITDVIASSRDDAMSESISTITKDRIKVKQKNAHQILITYSAMNYIDPNLEEYECTLTRSGVKNRITTVTPYITYYGLKPGKYLFSVNYIGSGDESYGSQLTIRITAPWYSSLFAKVLYLLSVVMIILFFLSYRSRKRNIEAERMRQLQEAQKEQKLAQEKMAFMTNVTHEIRTPVSVILILLERLSMDDVTHESVKEGLDAIKINAERLRKYCSDILDLRKIDNWKSRLVIKKENIVEIIRNSESAFSTAIAAKALSLDSDLPTEDIFVNCDREAVETIVFNLLSNAVKFAKRVIRIGCNLVDDTIRIVVDSDGDRIAEELSEKIFDAFYQVQRPDNYGSGVGLTFSRQIASMLGGRLYLDVNNAEMNSFVLELPVNASLTNISVNDKVRDTNNGRRDALVNAEKEEEEDINEDNVRILVVEDNEMMRNVLKEELSRQYDVCCASDGEEALAIVKNERIDLVVSDIMMPKMDGCELCNAIKGNIELSHIPVLLLTAAVGIETNLKSLQAGADAYIEKPFKMDILVAQISNLFKNRDIRNKQFVTSPLAHISCSSINKVEYEFVNSLHSFILNHISEPELSIDRLSNEMNMSRATLTRKVKANTGLTVNEYVRICRLKKAVELLSENSYRINEVAYLVGYTSASYFTKVFQKQFGKLPSEFVRT